MVALAILVTVARFPTRVANRNRRPRRTRHLGQRLLLTRLILLRGHELSPPFALRFELSLLTQLSKLF